MKKSCQIQIVILFWALLFSFIAWSQKPEPNVNSLKQAVQEAKLVVSKNYVNSSMGNAIAIDGNRAVVAANFDDNIFSNDGIVY
ncbi:MAG: FG-GAP repeat protein, partial [Marinicella sp.]